VTAPDHVFEIRLAQPSDITDVKDVYRRSSLSNRGDRDALLAHPDVLEWSERAVAEGRTWVASAGGRVVGFVSILALGRTVEIDDLFVDPDWMGRGIGRRLLLDAFATARGRAFRRVEVTANQHALGFYQKLGFASDFEVETQFGPAPRMHLDLFI
jgi:GNAT superfamily N-acetyltransferase